jgi:hypothetical protein
MGADMNDCQHEWTDAGVKGERRLYLLSVAEVPGTQHVHHAEFCKRCGLLRLKGIAPEPQEEKP